MGLQRLDRVERGRGGTARSAPLPARPPIVRPSTTITTTRPATRPRITAAAIAISRRLALPGCRRFVAGRWSAAPWAARAPALAAAAARVGAAGGGRRSVGGSARVAFSVGGSSSCAGAAGAGQRLGLLRVARGPCACSAPQERQKRSPRRGRCAAARAAAEPAPLPRSRRSRSPASPESGYRRGENRHQPGGPSAPAGGVRGRLRDDDAVDAGGRGRPPGPPPLRPRPARLRRRDRRGGDRLLRGHRPGLPADRRADRRHPRPPARRASSVRRWRRSRACSTWCRRGSRG